MENSDTAAINDVAVSDTVSGVDAAEKPGADADTTKAAKDADQPSSSKAPEAAANEEGDDDDGDNDEDDALKYIQRDEFTSEIYKIEIRNLGIFGIGELRKLIKNRLQLDVVKIKSPQRRDFAFVCFRNQKNQKAAITALKGLKWKGRVLDAYEAKPSADPYIRKRNADEEDGTVATRDEMPPPKKPRTAAEATCPLAEIAYDIQLNIKTEKIKSIVDDMKCEMRKVNPLIADELDNFVLNDIRRSPQVDAYRNKCEFTVGYNGKGDVVVGFRLGSYNTGTIEVDEVADLPHIPDAAKWAARTLEEFVESTDEYKPFDPVTHAGAMKQLMVRTSATTSDIMLVVGVNNRALSDSDELKLQAALTNFYDKYSGSPEFACTSLYYHGSGGPNKKAQPVHLWGNTHITDTILNCKFRIGPLSFFQVNTPAAEVLYQTAIQMARLQKKSIVLDICCGIGTIGICFAGHSAQVLGVEIVPDAIEDAKFNAKLNDIKNCRFIAGNAEHFIQSMTREVLYGQPVGDEVDLLAILDPPRAGLSSRTISYLRASAAIKKVLYISCEPQKAMKNFIDLCRPESKQYKGDPFVPTQGTAVDLFPHTAHVELVMLFERNGGGNAPSKTVSKEDDQPAAK